MADILEGSVMLFAIVAESRLVVLRCSGRCSYRVAHEGMWLIEGIKEATLETVKTGRPHAGVGRHRTGPIIKRQKGRRRAVEHKKLRRRKVRYSDEAWRERSKGTFSSTVSSIIKSRLKIAGPGVAKMHVSISPLHRIIMSPFIPSSMNLNPTDLI